MFLDAPVGKLVDAQSGDGWDASAIVSAVSSRSALFAQLGIQSQDRVILNYGNRPEFFIDLLAIWGLGACAIPMDARATTVEISNIAAATGARLSLWHDEPSGEIDSVLRAAGLRVLTTRETLRSPSAPAGTPSPGLDDDALILFTSGTTGQPKGVVHTRRSLRARWAALRKTLGTEHCQRTLCLLPTHFGHGLICNSLYPWLSGKDLFILPPFRTDLLLGLGELIDQHGITFMSSVPPVWRIALKMSRPPRRRTLGRVFCGSAPLSRHLWLGIHDWTGAAEVCNAYGITETGSWIAGGAGLALEPADGLIGRGWGTVISVARRGDTAGPPTAADQCAPDEAGFVWLNTPGLMRGYLGRDDLTSQVVSDGWFSTGDIGLLDKQGLLYLRGRQREEINKGGMKIFPTDVDGVIERFAGVLDVCTFGFEEALYGEDVGVAVVLENPATLPEVYAWTTAQLGAHRLPSRWYLLDEIPRTSRGKVNRISVAQACATRAPLSRQRLVGGSPDTAN